MIDKNFHLFRDFYRIYINNIVIFFILLKKYILYLYLIFKFLFSINIYLIFIKVFFEYLLIYRYLKFNYFKK